MAKVAVVFRPGRLGFVVTDEITAEPIKLETVSEQLQAQQG